MLELACAAGLLPVTGKASAEERIAPSPRRAPAWLSLPPTPPLPKPSRQGLANVNGVPVFYAQFGQGPDVLLLHGGLGSSDYWGRQIEALAGDFLVTVMDTRGHGRSPVRSSAFSYGLFAKDAVELLKQLEISRTAVVGWSDGAITGLLLAMNKPSLVSALFAFGANTTLAGLKAGGARTPVFARYSARCHAEYQKLSPEPGKWPTLQSGLSHMWRTEPNFSRKALAGISIPVLVADGEYDEIIKSEHTRQIAEAIPNAQLSMLAETSHFAMLQDPAQFNAVLTQFLYERL